MNVGKRKEFEIPISRRDSLKRTEYSNKQGQKREENPIKSESDADPS